MESGVRTWEAPLWMMLLIMALLALSLGVSRLKGSFPPRKGPAPTPPQKEKPAPRAKVRLRRLPRKASRPRTPSAKPIRRRKRP